MERREVPYARPAGRQANATQEAFARARSVWPRLDSTTGPSRGRTSWADLARGRPKPTCAGPPGRARACRVLCGLTFASSLFLFFLTGSSLSVTLSSRPFSRSSLSVSPSSFSVFPAFHFFSYSSRRPSFFFLLLFLVRTLFSLFLRIHRVFLVFSLLARLSSLSTMEFLLVPLRELLAQLRSPSQPTAALRCSETRLRARRPFSPGGSRGSPPPSPSTATLLHMVHAVSWLRPGREDEVAPKTNTEGGWRCWQWRK